MEIQPQAECLATTPLSVSPKSETVPPLTDSASRSMRSLPGAGGSNAAPRCRLSLTTNPGLQRRTETSR
jgi:hypothetical protein